MVRKFLLIAALFACMTLTSCKVIRFQPDNSIPIPQYERPEQPVKVALVLGGGGSRALAHVGVIEELVKENIPIDVIVGASAGGIVGALYADYPNIKRVKRILCPIRSTELLDYTLRNSRYGIVTGFRLRQFLCHHLYAKTFEELEIPLIIVATDLCGGDLVEFGSHALIPAIHASCAVPGMFRPVKMYGRFFVDGSVIDPIPVETARKYGADVVIAVDVTERLSEEHPTSLFGIMSRSFEICYLKLTEHSTHNADVLIQPVFKSLGLFSDQSNEKVYKLGREAAREAIPRIKELLEKSKKDHEIDS